MTDDRLDTQLTLRCPTCGAQQPAAESCRRCKTDLTLVASLVRHRATLRRRCLAELQAGQFREALRSARRCCTVSRDPENLQLLAVANLLAGDLDAALAIIHPPTSHPSLSSGAS